MQPRKKLLNAQKADLIRFYFIEKINYNKKGYAKLPSNSFAEIFVSCPIKNPAMSRV